MRLVALPLLVSLFAAACGDAAAPTPESPTTEVTVNTGTFGEFSSEELGFRIGYPPEWTVETDPDDRIVTFTAPAAEDGYTDNFNVSVGELPGEVPPAAYYQGEVGRLQNVLEDVRVLEQADVPVGDVTGRGITVVAEQNGLEVGISRLIVLRGGKAWEVTFVTPASRLEDQAPLISEIFKSFELRS